MADALTPFLPPVQRWFRDALGRPTPPQTEGWPAIRRGEHTLILAPTGSGKTLAAFLCGIDQLYRDLAQPQPAGVRLLYVSPLTALNNDVERNLRAPLEGIAAAAALAKAPVPAGTRPQVAVPPRPDGVPAAASRGPKRAVPPVLRSPAVPPRPDGVRRSGVSAPDGALSPAPAASPESEVPGAPAAGALVRRSGAPAPDGAPLEREEFTGFFLTGFSLIRGSQRLFSRPKRLSIIPANRALS